MNKTRRLVLSALTIAMGTGGCSQPPGDDGRVNTVLILADDLGVETIGAYGGTSYATPEIDRLAAEGTRFDNAHAQPLCTPSRVKLMTGQYNFRNYEEFAYLRPGSRTFGNLLRDAGYRTLVAGKWQLVRSSKAGPDVNGIGPTEAGFDEYFLWQLEPETRGERYWKPTIVDNAGLKEYSVDDFGPQLINNKVLEFIRRDSDQPFLVYYSMVLPHAPFVATPDNTAEMSTAERFAAMVDYMDGLVGNVRQAIVDAGIADRTFIMFIGDNGTDKRITSRRNGAEIRGGKGDTTAAGTHVPFITWGPHDIVATGSSSALVALHDVLPTLLEIADVAAPEELVIDGRSLGPDMRGEPTESRDAQFIHYEPRWSDRPEGATRYAFDVRWKLYEDDRFHDLLADPDELVPIRKENLSAEGLAARQRLQAIIQSKPQSASSREPSN